MTADGLRSAMLRAAAVVAILLPAARLAAQGAGSTDTASVAEFMNRWDLNKDGAIDDAEAEIARTKMRRERLEIQQKSSKPMFPYWKPDAEWKPEAKSDRVPDKDDPLAGAFQSPPHAKPAPQDAAKPTTKPSRDLNAGRPRDDGRVGAGPMGPAPMGPAPMGTGQRAIVSGGTRAGAPAVRPGYGATGPKVDLNAGRLPAGLPPARGMRPQVGSAPFRPSTPATGARSPATGSQSAAQRASTPDRPIDPPRPPLMPSSPGRITAEDIGLP